MSFELEKNGLAIIYQPVDSLLIIETLLNRTGRTFYCQVISFCFIPAGKKEPRKKGKKEQQQA